MGWGLWSLSCPSRGRVFPALRQLVEARDTLICKDPDRDFLFASFFSRSLIISNGFVRSPFSFSWWFLSRCFCQPL
uniref:Uncharacterized protein n=1 Tax=Rhizophora mucronata TaxID=61149 RepID=A0A2P2JAN8_RHIMU